MTLWWGKRRGSSARRPFDQRQQLGAAGGRDAAFRAQSVNRTLLRRKLIKLTMPLGSSRAVTFVMFPSGKSYRARGRAVTFVTLIVTRLSSGEAQRMIPGGCEFGTRRADAEAVGALPAHPRRFGGSADIARAPKREDEGGLLVMRPAIVSGARDRRMPGWLLVHRPG